MQVIEACLATRAAFEEAAQILADKAKSDPEKSEWAYPVRWLQVPWEVAV